MRPLSGRGSTVVQRIDRRQIVEFVAAVTTYRDRGMQMTRSSQRSAGSEIG
jgi:hypothetical protein